MEKQYRILPLKLITGYICIQFYKNLLKKIFEHYSIFISFMGVLSAIACYSVVVLYVSEFGIDFFKFSSLADVYRVALDQNIVVNLVLGSMGVFFFATIFIYMLYVFLFMYSPIKGKMWALLYYCQGFLLSALSMFFIILLFSAMYVSYIKVPAIEVRECTTGKYDITLRDKSVLRGVSIIAAVDSHFFLWDCSLQKSFIESKSYVTRVVLLRAGTK